MFNKNKIDNFLIIFFIISLIIKISFGIFMYAKYGTSKFCDDWDYISYAKNINIQGIFVPDISTFFSNSSEVGPGYPMIIALLFSIFGENYLPGIILNAIICSLIPVVIYWLAKNIFSKNIAIFSFIWSTFYILHIRWIPRIIKEEFLFLLFPLIIYLIIKESKKKYISFKFLLIPLFYAILIHMDERFFFYFPFLAISCLFLQKNNFKSGIKKAFVFIIVVVIFMIPWTIRNYQVYNKLAILTIRTSVFTDKLFGYTNENDSDFLLDSPRNPYTNLKLNSSRVDSIKAGKNISSLNKITQKIIKKGIDEGYYPHNYNLLEKWFYNGKAFFEPVRFKGYYSGSGYLYRGHWSLRHNILEGLTYGLLLPFFLIGTFLTIKRKNRYSIFLIIIIFLHTILHVVLTYVVPRYRIPIDVFVIIIAFYGFNEVVKFLSSKKGVLGKNA